MTEQRRESRLDEFQEMHRRTRGFAQRGQEQIVSERVLGPERPRDDPSGGREIGGRHRLDDRQARPVCHQFADRGRELRFGDDARAGVADRQERVGFGARRDFRPERHEGLFVEVGRLQTVLAAKRVPERENRLHRRGADRPAPDRRMIGVERCEPEVELLGAEVPQHRLRTSRAERDGDPRLRPDEGGNDIRQEFQSQRGHAGDQQAAPAKVADILDHA